MEKITEFWIPGIIRKISILLFLITTVVFSVFVIGSFQEFLDSTQLILLNIFEIVAGTFIITGFYHLIIISVLMIRTKSHTFISLAIIVAGEFTVIFFYLLANMISAVTKAVN